MIDISTEYMGLKLKNPLIVGSSGLTNSVGKIKEIEKAGAGAVVLKSLFEEQIKHEISKSMKDGDPAYSYPEAEDYISNYTRDQSVGDYLKLIKESKAAVSMPIIASVNCISSSEWINFAKKIEEAGADALELNVFIMPSDTKRSGRENEEVYFDIVTEVMKQVKIPIALKISYYFSSLAKFTLKLSWTGIKGMVLFNRFFSPDIDIDKFQVTPSHVFSTPDELPISLRWVAMLSGRLHCDIAASTGVHDDKAMIKQLLAGAKAVQISSVLYKSGFEVIGQMLEGLHGWMNRHSYENTGQFIGKMSFKEADNPAAYERVQFMKHFSGIE